MRMTVDQAQQVRDKLRPTLGYLARLQARMAKVGFVPNDRVYQDVADAQAAMQRLCMTLHYESCEHGVGMKPRDLLALCYSI